MRSPLATTIMLLAATVTAGCTAGAEPDTPPAPAPSPTTPAVVSTPAPAAPVDDAHALGDEVPRPGGVSGEVLAYRQPVAKDAPRPDEAGWVWAAADIRVCATDTAPPDIWVSDGSWSLTYEDGRIIEPSGTSYPAFPQPGFPLERVLPPGRCVRGWVTFGVPAGERPAWVEWSAAADPAPIRWTVG